jgi:hypothetical protein
VDDCIGISYDDCDSTPDEAGNTAFTHSAFPMARVKHPSCLARDRDASVQPSLSAAHEHNSVRCLVLLH